MILGGQEALANQDWRDAKLRLSNALATLGSGPELAELKAHAARLLHETDRQLVAQEAAAKGA